MKNLNENQKARNARTIRIVVQYALYCVVIGAIALIINGVLSTCYITVNWVKLLFGGALLYAVDFTCNWVFPKKSKKVNSNELL